MASWDSDELIFFDFRRLSNVPAGSLANALSVGAKTVLSCVVASASARAVASAAASCVLNVPAWLAVSTAQ
jgi:hypothetical protein